MNLGMTDGLEDDGNSRRQRWLVRFSFGAIASALAAIVTLLVLYVVFFQRHFFSSDDAVVNMLAGSMWEQGRLFPRDWVNNNGDLMIPSAAIIVAPLLNWLPNGFTAHSIGGVFAIVFMLGSLMALLRQLSIDRTVMMFVATLMAYGFSYSFISVVYSQTTYVWWPAGFFVGALLVHHFRSIERPLARSTWITIMLMYALIFCISSANPGRVALMMVAPLYVFDRVLCNEPCFHGEHTSATRRWFSRLGFDDPLVLFGMVAAFFSASVVYLVLARLGITEASYGAAALHWGGIDSVWRHARTFTSWFIYLGAPSSSPFSNTWSLSNLGFFRWAIALWVTWVGISEIVKLPWQADSVRRSLAAAMLVTFVAIAIPYFLFDPLAVNGSAMRYFTVPICIAVALSSFSLQDFLRASPRLACSAMVVAGVLLVCSAAPAYVPVKEIGSSAFWAPAESSTMRLAKTLQEEHLQWGYATWWNAGATDVHANSSLHVSPVIMTGSGLIPFSNMVSKTWYSPDTWRGDTFLALLHSEISHGELSILRDTLGEPKRTIDSGEYVILVFDRNISAGFGKYMQVAMNFPIRRGELPVKLLSARLSLDGDRGETMLSVRIRNDGPRTMSGTGKYPLSVGIRLLDAQGNEVKTDWMHWPLSSSIGPAQEKDFNLRLPATGSGEWRVRVDLVQEGVAWLGDMGMPFIELPLAPPGADTRGP